MLQEIQPGSGQDQMETQLKQRLHGRVRDLRVGIRDNGVVLQGFAYTWYAKQLAQHAAGEVTGLRILANEIVVDPLRSESWLCNEQ